MISNDRKIGEISFDEIVNEGDLTAEKCIELRKSTGMTIDNFAKKIGLNRKTIMRAEKGEISDRTFEYYLQYFNGTERGDLIVMTEKHMDLWDQTEEYLQKSWSENAELRKQVSELKLALKETAYQAAKYRKLSEQRRDEIDELRDRTLALIEECSYWKENSEIKDIKNPTEEDFPAVFHTEHRYDKEKDEMIEVAVMTPKPGKPGEEW